MRSVLREAYDRSTYWIRWLMWLLAVVVVALIWFSLVDMQNQLDRIEAQLNPPSGSGNAGAELPLAGGSGNGPLHMSYYTLEDHTPLASFNSEAECGKAYEEAKKKQPNHQILCAGWPDPASAPKPP